MSDESKLSSYLFFVEIDGIETARFQKCEGLEAETELKKAVVKFTIFKAEQDIQI